MLHNNVEPDPQELKPEDNPIYPPQQDAGPPPLVRGNSKAIRVILLLLFILSFLRFTLHCGLLQ